MVCVPCILLPFLLAIYLKFIQPLVLRLLPESWQVWFNSVLYPTCPAKPPQAASNEMGSTTGTTGPSTSSCPQQQPPESGNEIGTAHSSSSSSSLHDSDDFEYVNGANNSKDGKDKEA